MEDWDAAEPKTAEETKLGVPTTELFSRYAYYSELVRGRSIWEAECKEELPVDIEDLEIPVHVIKKKRTSDQSGHHKPPTVQACLPLQIRDISRIQSPGQEAAYFELFGFNFRIVTFFGRIVSVTRNEKWNQRYGIYTVDDGSGSIVVHYNHLKKELKDSVVDVAKVEQTLRLRRRQKKSNQGMISEDIRKLLELSRARLQLQLNYFQRGDRVLVLGAPFHKNKDDVRVFAYEITSNSRPDCDFEIYYKNLLFNAYCGYHLVNK